MIPHWSQALINASFIPIHHTTHENGGTDEINVAGLSGVLADPQTPSGHAVSHQNGGLDEINVAGLSGVLADPQTPVAHKSSHVVGGGDAFVAGDLLDATAKMTVRKNTGVDIGSRRRLNFIETSSVLSLITDDALNEEIDILLAALINIQDTGVSIGTRNIINFVDPSPSGPMQWVVTDDPGNSRVNVEFSPQWASTVSGLGNANSAGVETDLLTRRDHVHKRDVRVAKAGVDVGTRNRLNFIEGAGVTLTITDDGGADEVDITVAAAGGAAGGADTEVQFNNTGALDGAAKMTWDDLNSRLRVGDTVFAEHQIRTANNAVANSGIGIGQHNNGVQAPPIEFLKSRATADSPGQALTNDNVMDINAYAFGLSTYVNAARIRATLDQDAGFGPPDSRISFSVGSSNALTEKFRIEPHISKFFGGVSQPFATGSFTLPTAHSMTHSKRLELTGAERVTIAGTGRLGVYN